MNIKKILGGCLVLLGTFFAGNILVSAATYRVCEYSLPSGTMVTDTGFLGKTSTFPLPENEQSSFAMLYINNELASVSIKGKMSYINALEDKENKLDYGGNLHNEFNFYIATDFNSVKKTSDCLEEIQMYGVWQGDNLASKYYNGKKDKFKYTYKLTKGSTKIYDNLKDLNCSYKMLSLSGNNGIKGKLSALGVYENFGVKLIANDILNVNNSLNQKLLGVIIGNEDMGWQLGGSYIGGNSVDGYKTLLDALEKETCLPYLIYNPNDGFYLSNIEKTKSGPNLYGTDDHYSIYEVDYSAQCAEVKENYNKTISSSTERLDKIDKELDNFSANNNLTKSLRDAYYADIQNITNDMSKIVKCSEHDDSIVKPEGLLSKISSVTDKLLQSNNNSNSMTNEEKKQGEEQIKNFQGYLKDGLESIPFDEDEYNKDQTCETIFGDFDDPTTFGGMLQTIFNYVKIIAPILVISFGALDFGKAVISSDQDALKKAQSNFIKRCIAAVALYFLPLLINILLEMINQSTCVLK